MREKDEFALIRWLTEQRQATVCGPQANESNIRVGIGDDAAVIRTNPQMDLLLTCDTVVDGVHFARETMSFVDVGYKAMAAAVSDIAAMGGRAVSAVVAATVPREMEPSDLQLIYHGLDLAAADHELKIVGGDTVSTTGQLSITVTVTGEVPSGQAILRSGAQAGDIVFIIGDLGLSAAGLDWMLRHSELEMSDPIRAEIEVLKTEHRRPKAQLKAAQLLQESGVVHALNDVSDGLASECWEIAEASNQSIILYEELIPVHPALVRYGLLTEQSPLSWVLYGGEDYQLVGTAAATDLPLLQIKLYKAGYFLTMIGTVNEIKSGHSPEVELMFNNEQRVLLKKAGYNHFGGEQK